MKLRIKWKKPVNLAITVDPEGLEGAEDVGGNTVDNYTRIEIPFNSLIREFFEHSNSDGLTQQMFVHTKTQVDNPQMPDSDFTLDQIMHLHINFHKLAVSGNTG